ncbi:GPI transamidase component family protein / Gaa1-like family protein [Raphanus sativus]|nr:GPI transamidase component family protein / Gaa1-like family protein [Raphanus sativus]
MMDRLKSNRNRLFSSEIFSSLTVSPVFSFRLAGTVAAALVVKVDGRSERIEDTLSIYAEASNGQMPNLDLINVVNYLAVHRQGFYVEVEKVASLLSSTWLKIVGEKWLIR